MNTGWIKLHRKLLQNPIFTSEKGLKVWIWCLLRSNHQENEVYVGLEKVSVKSGEFIFGRDSASLELGMKPSTVRNWIQALKKDSYVDIKTTSKYSVISIKNWIDYQDVDSQVDNKVKTKQKQSDTDKNVKNEKNIYNSNEIKIFSHFGELKEDNLKVIELAKKYDIRPKDLLDTISTMLSKESEKGTEIQNVTAKVNIYVTNGLRWHYLARISDKEEKEKQQKKARLSKAERETLDILETATIRG